MKVRVMMNNVGDYREYEAHEAYGIIEAPEEYLILLEKPKHGEVIEKVRKDIFYLMIEEE